MALEPVKFIRRALLFRAGNIFQRVGGTVPIAGAA
jgi:hypothetical protein